MVSLPNHQFSFADISDSPKNTIRNDTLAA
jgi:hypothetical protein